MHKEPDPTAPAPSEEEAIGKAKGGKARAAALSPEERSGIARRGAEARWGSNSENLPKASYIGQLKIGDMEFPCSVLSDGTRILTQSDFMEGMGMYYSGWVAKNRTAEDVSADVPHFLSFSTLKPFVNKHLGDLQSISVKYRTVRGTVAHGIRAEIIPKICEIWLDADEAVALKSRQKQIATKAKILMRALAHVGIIALVDEATGYQRVRDDKALEKILNHYIGAELAKWAGRFSNEFYKQMCRLKGLAYDPTSSRRPHVLARITIDVVYDRIGPGLTEELKRKKAQKLSEGGKNHRLHQWLTDKIGIPALDSHLTGVTFLSKSFADGDWEGFRRALDRVAPAYNRTPMFDFDDPTYSNASQQPS